MPLLTSGATLTDTGWGLPVQLPGLPTFNLDDRDFIVTNMDGWEGTAKPDAVFVPNGGGPGGVASGTWQSQENYLTISGAIMADLSTQSTLRRMLLAAVPPGVESTIVVYGWDGVDLQAYVRLYDRPEFERGPGVMEFVLPLIMLDPYKYALTPVKGVVGVFTGQDWYDTYFLVSGTTYAETYSGASSPYYLPYTQAVSTSLYPISTTLTSDGDVSSQRVVAYVNGPLSAGDWWLLQENTGAQLWVDVSIVAGQTLTLNCFDKTADLAGSDVTHRVYGDWLTLEPGQNSYQLTSSTDNSDAFASIYALAAYQ